ncbi:MAG: SpoIID/LytB domain-containing protein [Candidatus Omnitrophota bacterium]
MAEKIKQKYLKIGIICFLLFFICQPYICRADNNAKNKIRVAILQDAKSLTLCVRGPYRIIEADNLKTLSAGENLKTTVAVSKGGIILGREEFKNRGIIIEPRISEAIEINGRQFRGYIEFILKDNDCLLVVNIIELEDYLKGILYHEISHYWPEEVLKAQAVASRTYAVYQMEQNKSKEYDLTCDIYSQVYGGKTSERYRTNFAVEQTKGQALVYQNKIFPAYFHATCAGVTENAALLWDINIKPLEGGYCGFCYGSPHYEWHCVLSLGEIAVKLNKSKFKVDGLTNIEIIGRDKSSRIKELKMVCLKGDIKIPAKDFRNIIGPNIIRSTNFNLEVVDSDAVFEGVGWGHGVGMCQWGAYFMAKKGYRYKDILKHYYPGSKIKLLANN